ncbi:glycerophosphodiester phosphodiesterase [Vibrio ishigakensis]|nr:glycerophosphodiester phosphodiesterase family protein [Vibrio ishigakensis]
MLVIAHRGARGELPENTLLAFESAIEGGARAIELDIHQHQGEFWVIHDKWVNRTTDGNGPLTWHSYDGLKSLDAGKGERIPTLDETLKTLAGRCAVNIELKGLDDINSLVEHLELAVNEYGFAEGQLLISSFNHHWLAELHRIAPQYKLAALTANKPIGLCQFAQELGAYSVNVDIDVIDGQMVDDAKKRGLKIFVYTVNREEDWKRLQTLGVDGIFCDKPVDAVRYFSGITDQTRHWPN